MFRVHRIAILFVISALLGAQMNSASSLIEESLSHAQSIKILVSIGNLQYAPINNLDVDALESKIRELVAEHLSAAGLRVNPDAPEVLIVSLKHARELPETDLVAVAVRVRYRQKAKLSAECILVQNCRTRSVTTWETDRLSLVPKERVREEFIEQVRLEIVEFVDDAKSARSAWEREVHLEQ